MKHPYRIDEDTYSDGTYKFDTSNVCHHCREKHEMQLTPFKMADTRTSFGIYAGRYCDDCWKNSGYRDATDPDAIFDPMDAGERLDDDY